MNYKLQFLIVAQCAFVTATAGCALNGNRQQHETYASKTSKADSATEQRPSNGSPETVDSALGLTRKQLVEHASFELAASDESSSEETQPFEKPPIPTAALGEIERSDGEATTQNGVDGVTLEELEQLAIANNPAIQQSSANANKAVGLHTQVGLDSNPTIGYFAEEVGNEGTSGLHGAFVSKTFVTADKLAWNQNVIQHDIQRTRWQVEARRFQVRTDVRMRFHEALGAQKRLDAARKFRKVAAKGVDVSKALLRVREGSLPDVLQSEVQLSQVDLSIQKAEFEFIEAWQRLVATAGIPTMPPTKLVGDWQDRLDDRDLESDYAKLIAESPLIAAACAQVRRARANLQRQRLQAIPNVNAQVGAGYDDGTGDEFANVQLSIGLPLHNKNQGNIQAAYAEYCAATQNVNRLKMQMRAQLATAIRAHQVALATVRSYEDAVLPKVAETLELMQKAQEVGEFDFLRVLTTRRTFFEATIQYVTAQTDLAKANVVIDGLLLSGGLDPVDSYDQSDELRGSALSGQ